MKWFGNAPFTPTAEHPGVSPIRFFNKKTGKWDRSSAAGGGQFLQRTWAGIERDIGDLDFNNLAHQQLAFVELFRDRGMLASILRGDVTTAMKLGAEEWASLPGSPYKQRTVSPATVVDTFNKQHAAYSGTLASALPANTRLTVEQAVAVANFLHTFGDSLSKTGAGSIPLTPERAKLLAEGIQQTLAATAQAVGGGKLWGDFKLGYPDGSRLTKLQAAFEVADMARNLGEQLAKTNPAVAKLGESAENTAAEIERNRQESNLEGAATQTRRRRNKLTDPLFTPEGIAGDFQGGLTGLLANLGWEKPTSLAKQFGIGLLRDIQGRLAHDMSAMISASLFGGRDPETNKLTGGGFLSKIFGSFFGGGRASGGPMEAGRFYMAGEHGRELVTGPGYVYNARETREMMSRSGEQRTYVYFGPKELQDALDYDIGTGRGRRRLIRAKWARKLTAVSY